MVQAIVALLPSLSFIFCLQTVAANAIAIVGTQPHIRYDADDTYSFICYFW